MKLVRYNPVWDLLDEMEGFDKLIPSINQKSFMPALDIYETDKAVVVEIPLAGVKPEDVEVGVEKGVLTLKGESKKEHEIDDKNYYRKEIRSGSFYREVALPTAVVESQVKAEFEDGILKIIAPKADKTKVKKINVKIINKNKK